jgi:hypothetical protein
MESLWKESIQALEGDKRKLKNFASDYDELDNLLKELPNKLKHSIMVGIESPYCI